MSIIDIILLLCFIPALIGGIRKGLVNQVISIISIILGIWMSFEFSLVVGEWLGSFLEVSKDILNIVAFVLILVVVSIALGLVGKLLEGIINLVHIGWVNRLAGALFSLIKSALIIGLVIIVFDSLNSTFEIIKSETLSESILYEPIRDFSKFTVFPYLKGLFS